MTGVNITCDRQGNLRRVAVWQGRELRDLYLDRIDKPDLTGAVVGGKVARVVAGQKAAWLDCGFGEMVYVEGLDKIRSGDYRVVRIKSAARQGKAWVGAAVKAGQGEEKTGILTPPPYPWQRAMDDLKGAEIASMMFANREDHDLCQQGLVSKEPVHPELDEIIDGLLQPTVVLQGGSNIVIEQTEALVAIDVNGEANNPLAVNLLAVREAARQIRLRNLAGIIVIDALKMKQRADNAKVLNALGRATESDPAGVTVFGMTKLGLIEITRTRRGPSLGEIMRDSSNGA
jgi:Ribonuclease G/E